MLGSEQKHLRGAALEIFNVHGGIYIDPLVITTMRDILTHPCSL